WALKNVADETGFLAALRSYFESRDDVTLPDDGWPWPWDDSTTTDRAYVFDRGRLMRYAWGKEIIGEDDADGEPEGGWPNMTQIKNVTLGNRSGMIVVRPR